MIKKTVIPLALLLLLVAILMIIKMNSIVVLFDDGYLKIYNKYYKGNNYIISELNIPQIYINTENFSYGDKLVFDSSTYYLSEDSMWYISTNKDEVELLLGNHKLFGFTDEEALLILLDRSDNYSFIEAKGESCNGIFYKEFAFFSSSGNSKVMNQNINSFLTSRQKQTIDVEKFDEKEFVIVSNEKFTNVYCVDNDLCYLFSFMDGDKERVVNCLKKLIEVD